MKILGIIYSVVFALICEHVSCQTISITRIANNATGLRTTIGALGTSEQCAISPGTPLGSQCVASDCSFGCECCQISATTGGLCAPSGTGFSDMSSFCGSNTVEDNHFGFEYSIADGCT